MKTSLFFVLAMLSGAISFAQEVPTDLVKRIINAPYIFEGTVIRSDGYFTADGRYIYTSHTIQISKILKGDDLDCGTVELITDGGTVGDKSLLVSHALRLSKGNRGVFLCGPTTRELPQIDFYPENNPQKLEGIYEEQSYIQYWWDGTQEQVSDLWQTFDSLAQVYNLTEYLTGINYRDCERGIKSTPSFLSERRAEPNIDTVTHTDIKTHVLESHVVLASPLKPKKKLSTRSIDVTYSLTNPIMSGTTTKFFEFDINIESSSSAYLVGSLIYMKYSAAGYGTNVHGNNNVQVTIDNNFPASQYPFYLIEDVQDSILKLKLTDAFIPSNLTPIGATTRIYHVKLKVSDCNALLQNNVTFVYPDSMLNGTWYETSASGAGIYDFNSIDASQILYMPDCGPHVSSFSPSVVTGGNNEQITVHGYQFGNTRGTGNIYLQNADDGGLSRLPLDQIDWNAGYWSDTLIKFYVPSTNDTTVGLGALSNPTYKPEQPAGTGQIKIKNDLGEVGGASFLTVKYSIINHVVGTTKQPERLISQGSTGGYKFYVDTLIWNHPERLACVNKALRDWSCETGVNWWVDSFVVGAHDVALLDSICVIRFGPLTSTYNGDTLLGKTDQWSSTCTQLFCPDIDITIQDNPSIHWAYDTTGIGLQPGERDFYATVLHELGHAHSLNHVIDFYSIMHYQAQPAGASATQRKIYLDNDVNSIEGGLRVINLSTNANYGCQGMTVSPMTPHYICEMHNDVATITLSPYQFEVYPNPYSDAFTIAYLEKHNSRATFKVVDVLGQVVIEKTITDFGQGTQRLNLSAANLPDGIYTVIANIDGKISSTRLLHVRKE